MRQGQKQIAQQQIVERYAPTIGSIPQSLMFGPGERKG